MFTYDSVILENIVDAGARKLEAEVDPEGPDHDESPRDPQHPPRRHLVHQLRYLKHLREQDD